MTYLGTAYTKNNGYFRNDNRASGGRLQEDDVRTCPHCQAVILMRQWSQVVQGRQEGGFCGKCNAPICPSCHKNFGIEGCVPFIQKLEKDFDMTVKLKQHLKIAGLEPRPPQLPVFVGNTNWKR